MVRTFRIGTRGSSLARWQADYVANRLRANGIDVEIVPIVTHGDQWNRQSLDALGTVGVFTKAIQDALLAAEVDIAVHSMKDLPTVEVPGLTLAAVPSRAPAGDILLSPSRCSPDDLPRAAIIGTGSRRRISQLLHIRPDLRIHPIRGNVQTRLEKLKRGDLDGLVLAEAGILRLGLTDFPHFPLLPDYLLPAAGQGSLAVETRTEDHEIIPLLAPLDDPHTRAAVTAERAFLAELGGGCLAPIAVWARMAGGHLLLTGRVLSADGKQKIEVSVLGRPDLPEQLGRRAAAICRSYGADDLLTAARQTDVSKSKSMS